MVGKIGTGVLVIMCFQCAAWGLPSHGRAPAEGAPDTVTRHPCFLLRSPLV